MEHTVKRALISVYDKTGVVELARRLFARGVEIVSSGGTARALADAGLDVREVSSVTEFPEILGGRVKTLHPAIHGGILADRAKPEHADQLAAHGIGPIDLVVVNLYPFGQALADPSTDRAGRVEMIDIGGPAMVRAAAKNHDGVGVVVSPDDYVTVADEIDRDGGLSEATRRRLAAAAFRTTARYDAAIAGWLESDSDAERDDAFPPAIHVELSKVQDLRYGENPHQSAAFYRTADANGPTIADARQLQGKELSFNNILDFDGVLALTVALHDAGCVIVKHGNPCGVALGATPAEAFGAALECDPTSAFGGVIGFNRVVDGAAAEAIGRAFYEGVVAPGFDDEARRKLRKKKNLRLLELGSFRSGVARGGRDLRRVSGGLLVQDWDDALDDIRSCTVASERAPSEEEWKALRFAWTVCKFVKSNAIVYADATRTLGIGAGQMSRVDSARIGVEKARASLEGAAMASDAFFPFRDGIDAAAKAGIRAVAQPGGSVRDEEVIAAANEHGIAMVLTGRRHFRH